MPGPANATTIPIDRKTVNIETAARELGIGRRVAYDLARRDALPVPVIRIGSRRMVISRAALDGLLANQVPGQITGPTVAETTTSPDR